MKKIFQLTTRPLSLLLLIFLNSMAQSQSQSVDPATHADRIVSGVIVTRRNERVAGVTVIARYSSGEPQTTSDAEGSFRLVVPDVPLTLRFEGKNIAPLEMPIRSDTPEEITERLQISVEFVVPAVHESVVIVSSVIEPSIERRNDAVYQNTLFGRDDQLFHTLDAGINAGQHEGGGKSLEIRRFGFNLDHGGSGGGLKVLVDNVQQNQGSQGHGQGYLGQLKSLTPELIHDVDILNGPFSAEYGDFSGLGVVHIRLKESLPDQLTLRFQNGSFDTFRTFLAYSPRLSFADSFIAYEGSRTNGPFLGPLRYGRDNVSGNFTLRLGEKRAVGLKLNVGRNDFFSSGQIPLDEVAAGRLDRFGFVDPDNGGRIRTAMLGLYYRQEGASGDVFKVDGFLSRSLFDLYSNFTFFLNDETNGDEIQQHDSRLQEGVNVQYLRPMTLFGRRALFIAGGNFHSNQINVGLFRSMSRNPFEVTTSARANVTNAAGYVQQAVDLLEGRLHMEGGLRFDYFRFTVDDKVNSSFSGTRDALRLQPKANVAFIPSDRLPATLYFNYGRGISSQDARGVVRQPDGERISTTDFYQVGTSFNLKRVSLTSDLFLIDRSNEQVYIPDDGSIEFAGPSRAYGFEVKNSIRLNRHLAFNGGLTRVMNAYFRGTSSRVYVDGAPHTVANTALTLADWRGFTGTLRYRHISNYRLDSEDPRVRAAGFDLLDFHLNKRVNRSVIFNLSLDNLTNKRYFETQNAFESRLRPGDPVISRIHGTPGYPIGATIGLTFNLLGEKWHLL